MTPVQLCNALAALDARMIGLRAFRVYVACFAAVAAREAAARARGVAVRRAEKGWRYRVEELQRLVGEGSARKVRADLARLSRVGLLSFEERAVSLCAETLPFAAGLVTRVAGSRSPTRPIPVPRAVLRFLARCNKPALTKTVVAYLLRGLSLDRRTGAVNGRGTVKLSWIAETFGVSERAARYARGELVRLGWFGRDGGSHQRKLNRDGAYFSLNLDWAWSASVVRGQADGRGRGGDPDAGARSRIAPRRSPTPGRFAPPIERLRTPYGSKNQKARRAESAGVFPGRSGGRPTLRDVRPEDLLSFARTEELYWQAVGRRVIEHSENNALNWLAAAVRAKSVRDGDPVRVFVGIVRRRLWSHVTQEQEERARQALARYREEDSRCYRERRAA